MQKTDNRATFGKVWALTLIVAATAGPLRATTFHVSPQGNDTWSGRHERPNQDRTDGPLATLTAARDAIRKLKAQGPLAAPVKVMVADGTYRITEPVVFEPADSGTKEYPIQYAAAPGARPLFTGGRALTGFQAGPDGVWTTLVPEVKAGQWYFEQLWVNGRRATRARTPNEFYLYMAKPVADGVPRGKRNPKGLSQRAFIAGEPEARLLLSIPKDQIDEVTLVAYHSWQISRHRIEEIEADTRLVALKRDARWAFFSWGPDQRYILENYREALDAPGEWFLGRDGTLHYKPLPGEDMAKAEVIAPVAPAFIQLAGQPEKNQFVEHLAFRGLSFHHGQFLLGPEGHSSAQADVEVDAIVSADGARNIALENCEIGHVGTYGVWFRRGCSDCQIVRSYLHDLGAGGIKIGETAVRPEGPERTGRIVADNNIIHTGGRIFAGAIGVWIGQSGDNRITHNDIGDFFYTGVSVGWMWGYGQSLTINNHIDFNHIHNLGYYVLSDMGAVYTLGLAEGSTVSSNVAHDIYSYSYGGWGLYNDEGSTHYTMENNLVYNTKSGGYHMHYGKENVIRNNIFAFATDQQIQSSRDEDFLGFTFERNIVYFNTGATATGGAVRAGRVKFDNNLYWDTSERPLKFGNMDLAKWQAAGMDVNSIVADPKFVDPAGYDFRLQPDSPAGKIGFKPFDYTKAGVYGDAAWIALARSAKFTTSAQPPPPTPPRRIDEDCETTLAGQVPAFLQVYAENLKDAVVVTDESPAGGKHCLKVQDSPDLKTPHNPHFFYQLNHDQGVTTASFDLKIEPGTVMYHQWRDDASPYNVGPSIEVRGGKLTGGSQPVTLPTGQWVHVEISAAMGDKSGTWGLTVTVPGKSPEKFIGLKNPSPEFKKLNWFGFSSTAVDKTAFYLDNLQVVNQK